MSDLPGSKTQAVLTRMWLEQMVGCDCDNGTEWRGIDDPHPCDRCVLVEVGGIRVRVLIGSRLPASAQMNTLVMLPAVEVADE